jgi:hypothetical protein
MRNRREFINRNISRVLVGGLIGLVLLSVPLTAQEKDRYFVGVCSSIFGPTAYRTQFELVNEQSTTAEGRLSFFDSAGEASILDFETIWVGDAGQVDKIDHKIEFAIPAESSLVILTVPREDGDLGWAKLESEGMIQAQAALQTASLSTRKETAEFDQSIQYQAELHAVEESRKFVFPISLYAGMKHLSTAFTVINPTAAKAHVQLTFRPDVVREIELDPGELLADYFERFWPMAFPAIYPLKLRGTAQIESDVPLAIGVFRTINGFPDLGIRSSALTKETGGFEVEPGVEFDLSAGQVASLPDSDLKFELWKIAEDSRCPIDVDCVWEGRLIAELRAISSSGTEFVRLSTQAESNSAEIEGYRITLLGVEPPAVSTEPLDFTDYTLHLVINPVN